MKMTVGIALIITVNDKKSRGGLDTYSLQVNKALNEQRF